jgi:hypothetical protein
MAWSVVQSVRAANHTFQALQRLLSDGRRAREAMYQLSLDLNALNRSVEARTHIVTVMSREMAEPHLRSYGMLIRLLNQYLRKRDAAALFEELSSI